MSKNYEEKCTSHPLNAHGRKISKNQADDFVILNYWKDLIDKFNMGDTSVLNEIVCVHYRKCVIESILSDPKCEGIRFYFSKKEKDGDLTLVLVGYDENEDDLHTKNSKGCIVLDIGYPYPDIGETYLAEVGGGRPLSHYWPDKGENEFHSNQEKDISSFFHSQMNP